MKITEYPELRQGVIQHLKDIMSKGHDYIPPQSSGEYQREGVHGSDLIYCNYKAYLRKTGHDVPMTDDQAVLFFTGHAMQFFLDPKHQKDSTVYEVDKIRLTPDIEKMWFGDVPVRLGELKTTRANIKKFKVEDNEHYVSQMLDYCMATKQTSCDFIVFFACGSYAPPFPTINCWHCEFTKEEISVNWKEKVRRLCILQEALDSTAFPSEHIYYPWECNYCELSDICPMKNGG